MTRQSMFNLHVHNNVGDTNVEVRVMVFNATFNNISYISWPSVLLVEETEVPEICGRSIVFFAYYRFPPPI